MDRKGPKMLKVFTVCWGMRTNIWVDVKKWAEWSIDIPGEVVE